jgi:hypothetical protein
VRVKVLQMQKRNQLKRKLRNSHQQKRRRLRSKNQRLRR